MTFSDSAIFFSGDGDGKIGLSHYEIRGSIEGVD
jgi:hypothetical protein